MALEGLHLNQYRILRLLGSGGMGEVYLAEDARIDQQVAIKISRSEVSSYPGNSTVQDTVRLFQREARAIAMLDHPYILPLFSYGEEIVNGMTLIYIVMPYRREGSFANWLQQRNSDLLPVQDVVHFVRQVADALQYAHDNQIVHQDVKPSNFLMRTNTEHPNLPDLLLADFGIARLNTSTANVSHSIRGTPTYMAPEQWSGEAIYATDQYALAILVYELFTGHPPFVGRQEQLMYQHFHVEPQPPGAFNLRLPREVNAVILKALAKQPENRFPSISAFANALQLATVNLDASTIIKTPLPAKSSLQETDDAISSTHSSDLDQSTFILPPKALEESTFIANRNNPPPVPYPSLPSASLAEVPQRQLSARRQSISTGSAILLVGLAFLLLIGSLSIFYFYNINKSSNGINNTITSTSGANSIDPAATSNAQANNATSITLSDQTNATSTAVANQAKATSTPTANTYVQLKSSYSGTASGYANGAITFTLESEDQQGHISMQTTFQQLQGAQKTASYSCQGTITTNRYISLQCTNIADPTYLLTITGNVFSDGHMEGTETATNTNNSTYSHVYSWKAY